MIGAVVLVCCLAAVLAGCGSGASSTKNAEGRRIYRGRSALDAVIWCTVILLAFSAYDPVYFARLRNPCFGFSNPFDKFLGSFTASRSPKIETAEYEPA